MWNNINTTLNSFVILEYFLSNTTRLAILFRISAIQIYEQIYRKFEVLSPLVYIVYSFYIFFSDSTTDNNTYNTNTDLESNIGKCLVYESMYTLPNTKQNHNTHDTLSCGIYFQYQSRVVYLTLHFVNYRPEHYHGMHNRLG